MNRRAFINAITAIIAFITAPFRAKAKPVIGIDMATGKDETVVYVRWIENARGMLGKRAMRRSGYGDVPVLHGNEGHHGKPGDGAAGRIIKDTDISDDRWIATQAKQAGINERAKANDKMKLHADTDAALQPYIERKLDKSQFARIIGQQGFTVIEILFYIAVIGALAWVLMGVRTPEDPKRQRDITLPDGTKVERYKYNGHTIYRVPEAKSTISDNYATRGKAPVHKASVSIEK